MEIKLNNGKIIKLGKDEYLDERCKCPKCGSQVITKYGVGISCEFCTNCDYNFYDYDLCDL